MKPFSWFLKNKFVCFILFFLPIVTLANPSWQLLIPGLQYTMLAPKIANPWGKIHVFQLDSKKFKFNLALASNNNPPSTTVQEFAKEVHALLVINGGFFTPQFEPIGLRVNNGVIKNHLKKISWFGVFYLTKSQQPKIVKYDNYRASPDVDFAIQSGPRLIIDNTIPKLKGDIADRTAIGITDDKKIIIAVTERFPMLTSQLATLLQKEFHCRNALNLDGGRSSQIYSKINDFLLSVENFSRVSDVVWVSRIPVIAKE